jgi:hypothetical protein
MILFITAVIVFYACYRTSGDEGLCEQAAPASYKGDRDSIVESLKSVADHSNDLSNWAILMIAGSIAMVVGTSYLRPQERNVRLAYLVFVPAWFLLAISILAGRDVKGGYLASTIVVEKYLFGTVSCANAALSRQIDFLFYAVALLSIWLLVFLHWWVFSPRTE